MKGSLKTTCDMEKAVKFLEICILTKVNSTKTKFTEMVFAITQAVIDMRDNGKTTIKTEKAFFIVQTAIDIKANMKMD